MTDSTNRLIYEESPYLLLHACNPVDWYTWSEEAFQRAEAERKLVFLSVGYSTCHWCHVMARESFQDSEIAGFLNNHYISIKVDREERPDIDGVYMKFCQALTGHGGWPLSVFLTPAKTPVFAGTYFPPRSQAGRLGFYELLVKLNQLWLQDREKITCRGKKLIRLFKERGKERKKTNTISEELLAKGAAGLAALFDSRWGGFGGAPKFPVPHNLSFLLRWYRRTGAGKTLHMVEKTLSEMARGGIYDCVGGGFHRYSTDARWHLPHFEKMLYDQALLILAYTEVYQLTGSVIYRRVIEKTVAYVHRVLLSPQGAFYTAEDADSEGEEGKYYLWHKDQILSVLGQKTGTLFCELYGVEATGNFLDEAVGTRNSLNVLRLNEGHNHLEEALESLYKYRSRRCPPAVDTKIITAWNGLMIAALARAGRVLGRGDYLQTAGEAARFIIENMMGTDNTIGRCYSTKGCSKGFLDDYSFFTWGLLELYQAYFRFVHFEQAVKLTNAMLTLFGSEDGGLYYTPAFSEGLPLRERNLDEGAMPSAAGVAAANLIKLGILQDNNTLITRGKAILNSQGSIFIQPEAHAHLLGVIDRSLGPRMELILTGPYREILPFRQVVDRYYLPDLLMAYKPPSGEGTAGLLGLVYDYPDTPKAGAFLCVDRTCRPPLVSEEQLKEALSGLFKVNS